MSMDTFELLGPDGAPLPGYLAAAGPAAMIVIHESYGLNEQIKNVARRLAKEANLTAFALDLFDGHSTLDLAAGFRLAQTMSWKRAIDLVRRARQGLSDLGGGSKVGVVGFSFGAGVALAAAAHIAEIAACVPFYGIPTKDRADLMRITCKVQGHFAQFDTQITGDRVDALADLLAAGGVSAEIHRYHAQHAFFNEVRKETHSSYNSQHAWHRMLAFLQRELC